MIGKPGHARVMDETDTILDAIKSAGGFLPYHDKTPADEIYRVFGMSKKTFKMTIGTLYKRKLIKIEETGIRLSGS
jgi:predicted RNA-binding protein (virulence factor B family)